MDKQEFEKLSEDTLNKINELNKHQLDITYDSCNFDNNFKSYLHYHAVSLYFRKYLIGKGIELSKTATKINELQKEINQNSIALINSGQKLSSELSFSIGMMEPNTCPKFIEKIREDMLKTPSKLLDMKLDLNTLMLHFVISNEEYTKLSKDGYINPENVLKYEIVDNSPPLLPYEEYLHTNVKPQINEAPYNNKITKQRKTKKNK